MRRFGENLNEDAGPVLFHLSGYESDVEGALVHEEARDVAHHFGGFIVEITFELDKGFGDESSGLFGVAKDKAHYVRVFEVSSAGPVANGVEGHGRDGAVAIGDFGEDGGAGGGD